MKITEWVIIYEDGNAVGTMSPVYGMKEWLERGKSSSNKSLDQWPTRSKHNEK